MLVYFCCCPDKSGRYLYFGRGRFGDKIIYYVTAKWISFKFNIPLLFKPFRYSSMLRLGREEKKYSKEIVKTILNG